MSNDNPLQTILTVQGSTAKQRLPMDTFQRLNHFTRMKDHSIILLKETTIKSIAARMHSCYE